MCVSCIVSEFFVYISSIFIKRISEILQDVFLRYCQIHLFDFWVQFSVEEEVNWAQTFPLQSLESIKDLTSCPKQKVSKLVANTCWKYLLQILVAKSTLQILVAKSTLQILVAKTCCKKHLAKLR